MKCPICNLENPPEALRCDCGYDFPSGTTKTPYLTPKDSKVSRFHNGSNQPLSTFVSHVRIFVAAGYWLLVLFVFVGLSYADPGWAEGGIPLVAVCLPWSLPVLLILGPLFEAFPSTGRVLATDAGNFFFFVVVCGGLNSILILGIFRALRWMRSSVRHRIVIATTVVVLVAAAQLVMPIIDRDALERSRPHNVPKAAVHVGGSIGCWQHCTYDSTRHVDQCEVWYRGGDTREEGEFVPYDGGAPATDAELQIVDINEMDAIGLRNGRILIPKARETQIREFLDGVRGKRPTP